jgi:uncharacterized membrane protein
MTAARLRALSACLALAGAAIAAYLSYTRLGSVSIMCPTSGCETVQRSSYSKLAGIPVAYLGFAMYLIVAASVLARGRRALHVTAAIVAAAVGFSAYLLVVQLAVIAAVCVWCVASDGVILALAVVTAARMRIRESPDSYRARLSDVSIKRQGRLS